MDKNALPSSSEVETASRGRWARLGARLRRSLLYFLDAIGLWEDRSVDHQAQLARLRLYHTEFRKLLSANNSFLEMLGDLDRKRLGLEFFDACYIRRRVVRAIADIHAMVESLNGISGDRYPLLRDRLESISATLTTAVQEDSRGCDSRLVIDLSETARRHSNLVGGKMANLGALRNELSLPAPDGMTVTTEGYRLLIENGGLRSWIQDIHMELLPENKYSELSSTIQEQILGLSIPIELEKELLDGFERLCERTPGATAVAVRSSAVGEDSEFSFAGQYLSLLNVHREELCSAYLQVMASLYSPEAVNYRALHGIAGESAEMAVGILAMIDAQSSGTVFSRDPADPDSGMILIQAVKGLGLPLVDGRVSPEVILIPRSMETNSLFRRASAQSIRTRLADGKGVQEEELSVEEASRPCISDEDALQLARWALLLEEHFGSPQDIEWAVNRDRRPMILQARPLRLPSNRACAREPVPGAALLLSGGEVACPGVGAGPAVHMEAGGDLESFPDGAVLVARRSSPSFIRLMSKTRAIVTDVGSTTGHMASLAREFGVPTLLNARKATSSIPPGMVVTVDANSGFVYQGDISELTSEAGENGTYDYLPGRRLNPEFVLLDKVLELCSPLNLTDPSSSDFAPEKCLTLHDIARFVHEKSYREMFMLGENVGDLRGGSYQLDVFLPIDLYIIDLGGGLKVNFKERKVKPAQIISVPMASLVKGMLHEKIPRFGARPIDVKGLFSIMMRHAVTNPEEESSFREPCYAIISDKYLNYTARVGYHFSIIDAYCGDTQNKNYISVLFRGGAADYVRRNRRVRSIGEILKEYGFSAEVSHDMVSARLSKAGKEEMIRQLEMLGSLFQFFRQMDAAMTDESSVALIRDAFLSGDYALDRIYGR